MYSGRRQLALTAATLVLCYLSSARAGGPLSPEQARADLQVPAGLRVELVAAEPEVVDPVAIAFDEEGRLWVVEMRDYPTLSPGEKPTSRIRVLRDRDGEGRYETATTFVEGLLFPTGVQPWRGGVIVTLAGEIAYFPDADRDDRADGKQVWYRGFATENEQLRANHPTLAPDGRVYVAGGLRGGTIANVRHPNSPAVSINGRDFAFDPMSGHGEAVTGNGQFGLTFDDFGRRFTCSNRNPLVQVMIEQRYLQQNPKLVPTEVVQDVAAAGDASRLYPRTRAITTASSHAGQFTAACSVEIYRGHALPDEFHGSAFVCEPTANLVHREVLDSSGVAFTSHASPENGEFLTSSDDWFRPVNLATGPDGALYVVDMYRAVIEHPAWMPEELRNRADLLHGNERGRIYRIVAEEARHPASIVVDQTPQALLNLLEHPNAWQRETAARLIRESNMADAEELHRLATQPISATTRCAALLLLHGLGLLKESTLLQGLTDSSPAVRERTLVLAESQFIHSPSLTQQVLRMADDTDSRVRFQVALSLSMLPADAVVAPLTEIGVRDAANQWTRRAVVLASREQSQAVLAEVLQRVDTDSEAVRCRELIRELSQAVVATGEAGLVAGTLTRMETASDFLRHELLLAMVLALGADGMALDEVLTELQGRNPQAHAAVARQFQLAISAASDDRSSPSSRIEAIQLLHHDRTSAVTDLLVKLVSHDSPAIQIAAIQALARRGDQRITVALLKQFPAQLPSVRRASLDLLLATSQSAQVLLEAVQREEIAATDIDAARAERLKKHPDAQVRELAAAVLGNRSANRAEVVRQYRAALELAPDRQNGRQVFAAHCAACHRLGGEGTAIGPDIGDSALRTSEQLLTDILQPSLAVDANFVSYTAVTHEGRVHQGVIRMESDSGIVLATAEGKLMTISRDDLESLNSSGTSLMPEGLEQQISLQQMADLIGYLRNWRETVDQ